MAATTYHSPAVASAAERQCLGRVGERRLLSSPLVVLGKKLELSRNHLVGHGSGSAKQRPRCLQILLAAL
jgi:hypothetical protein